MKFSQLFTKTVRQDPKDEISVNAKLLDRAGFVHKNSAGIYTFLPLGWRVIEKISNIISDEIDTIGGQKMFMPALVEKKYLDATGRWDVEIGFEVKGKKDERPGFVLGWTHEEVLTEIISKYISSYRDLPFAAYQIQTKFRNEPRAKSGLLRGREFIMKDLYSFHESEENLLEYYEKVRQAYNNIFQRCGLEAIYTLAAGGDFTSSHTHEFQVIAEAGEDTIHLCEKCKIAVNEEIIDQQKICPSCGNSDLKKKKSIEVGNIFPLGTKYSEAFNLKFKHEDGNEKYVFMGSYGIGLSRVIGTIVEIHHDDKGIIWPESVAPFRVHLIELDRKKDESAKIYSELIKNNIEVLYDDRDKTAGEKFTDADLIGCPIRIIVSEKTLKDNKVEIKKRIEKSPQLANLAELISSLL